MYILIEKMDNMTFQYKNQALQLDRHAVIRRIHRELHQFAALGNDVFFIFKHGSAVMHKNQTPQLYSGIRQIAADFVWIVMTVFHQ